MKTGWTGMRLGIVAFLVPFVFVYSPELLMVGTAVQIGTATLTATIGVFMLSAGLAGYLLTELGPVSRVLFLFAGIVMIVPGWVSDIIGASIGVACVLYQWKENSRTIQEVSQK
jgi:TRAP-type uncharacterized transport system fused permease subunit